MILQVGEQNGGHAIISMKILGVVLFVSLFLIPNCSAGSIPVQTTTALPAQPYITINPVGDHTLDEVFFISGTTNLPVSSSPLILQIYSAAFNPGGSGCGYQSKVIIEPGVSGINTWSCNATPGLWQTHGIGPSFKVTPGAVPGDYLVHVSSQDPGISANDTQLISILSPEDTERGTAANHGVTPTLSATGVSDPVGYEISDSPVSLQNSTQGTAGQTGNPPREVPTTHPAPLLPAVSIAAMGLGAYAILGRTNNGGSA